MTQGIQTRGMWLPAKGIALPSPNCAHSSIRASSWGHGRLGGQSPLQERETHCTHLHSSQTYPLLEEPLRKNFNKPHNAGHHGLNACFWEPTPRKQLTRGRKTQAQRHLLEPCVMCEIMRLTHVLIQHKLTQYCKGRYSIKTEPTRNPRRPVPSNC